MKPRAGATGGRAPLGGLVVVVTRPGAGDEPLTRALTVLGAEVRPLPALVIEPPRDPVPLERALARWADYDWVAFTSPRGVSAVAEAMVARGSDPRVCPPRRLAVVGPTTAAAARNVGWTADLVPERFDADGLLVALERSAPLTGRRILLPVAETTRETLGPGLRARGAVVDQVAAYRSGPPSDFDAAGAADLLSGGRTALVTLASPSAARNLLELLGPAVLELPAAAIGPVTAEAARELGFQVVAQPRDHTLEALAEAVVRWWEGRGG